MPPAESPGPVDRTFRLVVLDLPGLLKAECTETRGQLCGRIERLLDAQVRVAFVAEGDEPVMDLCRGVSGLAKVFLFIWTAKGELLGFNQWGRPVRLARGDSGDPSAGARYLYDAVADPAEIPAEEVLVVAESFAKGTPAAGFLAPEFEGARFVAFTQARKVPPGVRRLQPDPKALVAVLDAVMWHLA